MNITLDRASKIAEIAGAIAVVMSLLYVGYQVQQNTRAVRSTVHQSLVNHVVMTEGLVMTSPELARIILKGENEFGSLTPDEQLRLEKYIMFHFVNWENAYLNWNQGLLDDNMWRVWDRSHHWALDSRAYFEFWSQNRDWFDDSFANYVDGLHRK